VHKVLESPVHVPDEAFMVLELVPGSMDDVEGKNNISTGFFILKDCLNNIKKIIIR